MSGFDSAHFVNDPVGVQISEKKLMAILKDFTFTSPEMTRRLKQVESVQSWTTASDMYSLGALMYAVLTGHYPWSQHSMDIIVKMQLAGEEIKFTGTVTAIDDLYVALQPQAELCLGNDPKARPTTIDLSNRS
jgi:serine/threonine protein kinase